MSREVVRDLVARGVLRVEDGNHGNDRPRPDEFVADGVAFIRAADMTSGVVDFDGAGKIADVALRRIRKGVGLPGDVILSHKGTVGRVAVAPLSAPDFVCSPQTTFWRSLDQSVIDQRYLRYVLVSSDFQRQLGVFGGQTDMAPYVSLTDQRSVEIEVPDIGKQQAIAEVLGALDDKIVAVERNLKLLDELCAAEVSRSIVGGAAVQLRELATLHYGKSLPATQRMSGDVPVLGSGGPTGFHDTALVGRAGVVLGRKGTVGSVHWVDRPHFPIDTTYFVEPLGPAGSELMYYLLRTVPFSDMNSDSAVPGLNREEAYAQVVRVPRDPAEVTDRLKVRFQLGAALRRESAALTDVRDGILPLLMSGKVRVKDAEKTVEGVL